LEIVDKTGSLAARREKVVGINIFEALPYFVIKEYDATVNRAKDKHSKS
jgi:hypothetical protein